MGEMTVKERGVKLKIKCRHQEMGVCLECVKDTYRKADDAADEAMELWSVLFLGEQS